MSVTDFERFNAKEVIIEPPRPFVWVKGEPPKKNDKKYLVKLSSGMIVTVECRYGRLGEPQQDHIAWRCACCGRFVTTRSVEYWTHLENI